LVIGILFLLLVVGLVPTISAIAINDVKEDSSKYTPQTLWPPSRRYFVIGIMEVISSNTDFYNNLQVRAIFPILPILTYYPMKPFQYYEIKNFEGYYSNYIVIGRCYAWCTIAPP
jgi:hypothetical protein